MRKTSHTGRPVYPRRALEDEEEGPEPDLEGGNGAEAPVTARDDWNFETSHRLDIDWRDEPL